jgi:hypothetical protein
MASENYRVEEHSRLRPVPCRQLRHLLCGQMMTHAPRHSMGLTRPLYPSIGSAEDGEQQEVKSVDVGNSS